MARSGIARIDALLDGSGTGSIGQGDTDRESVGALQDLLIGHGARLPGIRDAARGQFGPKTAAAVQTFQAQLGMPTTGAVDSGTLSAMVSTPCPSPIAAQAYLTLVLGVAWSGMARLVALTAQFEAAGKFTAQNRNTDRAGLSFGIIQWAQRPGRLHGLLVAFQAAQSAKFTETFGDGNPARASGLLSHTAKPNGGVNNAGVTTDPAFDLASSSWGARFRVAGQDQGWQRTQLDVAIAAFKGSMLFVQKSAPAATSERAMAFLLDVANQHGNGGLQNICRTVTVPGQSEADLLLAVERESVRRLKAQFGENSAEARSTQDRRTAFRTTPLLSDAPFVDA